MAPKEATRLIDEALSSIIGRDTIAAGEMTDLLLDIRLHLIANEGCETNIVAV